MVKLLVGLLLWGVANAARNQKIREEKARAAESKKDWYFKPTDPIPADVVDVDSWKWDIEHFNRWQIINWYSRGKYKKIIRKHPDPEKKIVDWNKYEHDMEKYKSEKYFEDDVPDTVSHNVWMGFYEFIEPQDENGNLLKEWPDKEEWEWNKTRQIKLWNREYERIREERNKKLNS